ncbi:MAG: hypothetical protein U9N01_01885 [Euryarchaeota archaeon]|nr:hypothetical protein [Euryarchaeota archaeon]
MVNIAIAKCNQKVTTRLHNTFSLLQKTFLQAKTFTKNTSFFGKAFFSKERFVLKEKRICSFAISYRNDYSSTF